MGRKDAFRRAAEGYLAEIKLTRTEATHRTYTRVLSMLHRTVLAVGVTTYLDRWTFEDLMKVLGARSHLLPGSFRHQAVVLRQMLKWAGVDVAERAIRSGRLRLPPPSRMRVRWYGEERLAEIRAACRTDAEYAMVVLTSELGLRRSEVVKLRIMDINGDVAIIQGKGGKVMPVPLTRSLVQTVESWMVIRRGLVLEALAKDPMSQVPKELLIWRRGPKLYPYRPDGVTSAVRRVGKRLGIPLCPHDLRRSCGRELYKATRDLIAVNRLLRHESIDQTRQYIGADLEDARWAMEARDRLRAPTAPIPSEPATQT